MAHTGTFRSAPRAVQLLVGFASTLACLAIYWQEANHYRPLGAERLDSFVGLKGDCCDPPKETPCDSVYPYSCGDNYIVCDYGDYAVDSCGGFDCKESNESRDHCDTQEFAEINVTLSTCMVCSSAPMVCGEDGSQCAFITGTEIAGLFSCGTASVCSTSSGGVSCH